MDATDHDITAKPHIKIVIIGRTGAGKTTFINTATNLFHRVRYMSPRLVAITQSILILDKNGDEQKLLLANNIKEFAKKQSEHDGGQNEAQTQKCNIYTFENENFKFSLIDTPGLGDTRGPEQDDKNAQNIVAAVEAITDFHGIILVHKASDARSDTTIVYLINRLKSILTEECKPNFFICFTHVLNSKKIDAEKSLSTLNIPLDKKVLFENDCFQPPLLLKNYYNEDEWEDYVDTSNKNWVKNQTNFDRLLVMLQAVKAHSARGIVELFEDNQVMTRIVLKECHKIETLNKDRQIAIEKEAELKLKLAVMEANKDFTQTLQEKVVTKKKIKVGVPMEVSIAPSKITQCLTCLKLCHNPCYLDQVYSRGHISLKGCAAFHGRETCQSCNHHYSTHIHSQLETRITDREQEIEDVSYKTVTNVDEAKKHLYTTAETAAKELKSEVNSTKAKIKDLSGQVDSSLRMMAYLYNKISQTSMQAEFDYHIVYLEYLHKNISNDTKLAESERQKRLDENLQRQTQYITIRDQVAKNSSNFTLTSKETDYIRQERAKIIQEQKQLVEAYRRQTEAPIHIHGK